MEEKEYYHTLPELSEEHRGIYDILEKILPEERSQFIYDALVRQYYIKLQLERDKNILFDIVRMQLPREEVMKNNNISEFEWEYTMKKIIKTADREKKRLFDIDWSESE